MRIPFLGYEIKLSKEEEKLDNKPSVQTFSQEAMSDEAALDISSGAAGYYVESEGTIASEARLINKYRSISLNAEVERAVDEIVNEAVTTARQIPVQLKLDNVTSIGEATKKSIQKEFEFLMKTMDFKQNSQEFFKRWYIDGRIYFHKVIDLNSPKKGILKIKFIDPRKIRKVREIEDTRKMGDALEVPIYKEYFIYNPKGFVYDNQDSITDAERGLTDIRDKYTNTLKIAKDAVVYANSGIMDVGNKIVIGHLHKAIKPLNQLRMQEDAIIIYRIARAPERRVFNIEVGDLPRNKAEQHIEASIAKIRSRLRYNNVTGDVMEDKRFSAMLEDFFFASRDGKGTKVDVLPSGQNLGELQDIDYFRKKLYESLNVPMSRMQGNEGSNIFNSSVKLTEINREEFKFLKFIDGLRRRFSYVFEDLLKTQLILKGVITADDWEEIRSELDFEFIEDSRFLEARESEMWNTRFESLQNTKDIMGDFVSRKWVQRNILKQTDEEIAAMEKEILEEREDKINKTKEDFDKHKITPKPDDPDFGPGSFGFDKELKEPEDKVYH